MRFITALACVLAITTAAAAQDPPRPNTAIVRPDRSSDRQFFAVIYRPGPGWKAGQPMSTQDLREHLLYYRRGLEEGHVFAGGGLVAINGGLAILTMSNLEEAQRFLAADPAILNGTFVGEVNAWTPAVLSDAPLKK